MYFNSHYVFEQMNAYVIIIFYYLMTRCTIIALNSTDYNILCRIVMYTLLNCR